HIIHHSCSIYTHTSFQLPSYFFFNDTATTEIYTLSLHDALPILATKEPSKKPKKRGRIKGKPPSPYSLSPPRFFLRAVHRLDKEDRKSTRLNSSHVAISYAVFCLKKKKKIYKDLPVP